MKRCHTTDVTQLTWGSKCEDSPGDQKWPMAYNWQAKFRTKHIWDHPALKPYQYMLWFDSDALATQVWKQDPVATLIRNQLVLLFDNFPAGASKGHTFNERIQQAFNKTVCGISVRDGHLETSGPTTYPCKRSELSQVHGFFHVTDLTFYRSDAVQKWNSILIGSEKYSRQFDDQIGVTVPAVVLAPEKAWHMGSHGFNLRVMHNGRFDGKIHFDRHKEKYSGKGTWYLPWFELYSNTSFLEARDMCLPLIVNEG